MNNVVDTVNQILQDFKNIESSPFYKNHLQFSKMYESLIQKGVTQRRESQLKSIQESETASPFSYNLK